MAIHETIGSIVISLILIATGVFSVFYIMNQATIQVNSTAMSSAINNTSALSDNVFAILGIVLIIAAIMSIIGLIYAYLK